MTKDEKQRMSAVWLSSSYNHLVTVDIVKGIVPTRRAINCFLWPNEGQLPGREAEKQCAGLIPSGHISYSVSYVPSALSLGIGKT